ncbi:hypothetical protein B9479_007680 [Cryptococcus floricola]|uniref:YDG domain-containing protein n=1 Tax=Cryptococcus floricola TaxID=2591691 RepID=A0A5D3AM52_9TREE|nr:hypothetical protein B9479_007680 [Cryptococcus floricola]
MTLSYEQQRLQNIKDNADLLKSLGLSSVAPAAPKTPKATTPKPTPSKTKKNITPGSAVARQAANGSSSQNTTPAPQEDSGNRRRSLRTGGKNRPNYLKEQVSGSYSGSLDGSPSKRSFVDDGDDDDDRQRKAQKLGVRLHDPKTFGHIPNVEVGRWWSSRMEASTDAIHAPTVAGISGNAKDGAWSVALSGGYPDDIDLGYAFTFSGCGGRELKGTKQNPKNLRTAPQTSHQSFDNPLNAALKRSAERKKPVRVVRGYKLQSKYAPVTGYRYDGLYIVEKAWMSKGLTNGLMVCRYAFKRMDGQPPLPENDLGKEAEEADSSEVPDESAE